MRRHTRGSDITLVAEGFKDEAGDDVTPTSVRAYIDYPIGNRGRGQADYAMTDASGEWTYVWDSSVAYPGTVFWTAAAIADDTVRKDDEFQLTAGAANPDP